MIKMVKCILTWCYKIGCYTQSRCETMMLHSIKWFKRPPHHRFRLGKCEGLRAELVSEPCSSCKINQHNLNKSWLEVYHKLDKLLTAFTNLCQQILYPMISFYVNKLR